MLDQDENALGTAAQAPSVSTPPALAEKALVPSVGSGQPKWRVGELVDVQDAYGDWYEAMVMEYMAGKAVVHFSYWSSRFDEKLDPNDARIAPHGTHVYVRGGSFKPKQLLDLFDKDPTQQKWTAGSVVAVGPDTVTVHFKGFTSKYDEVLPFNSDRIAPFGHRSKTKTVYRRPTVEYWKGHVRGSNFTSVPGNPQFVHYLAGLQRVGCVVKSVLGDGNCLFRSFSHQVYGSEDHHAIMRRVACDYMELEQAWFLPFIGADEAEFRAYLEEKRRDRVWGDDPEIQALCEVFDRPAEIYVYDAAAGARKLRTFHAARRVDAQPIRLSYYGGGHYDSIIGPGFESPLLRTEPGVAESQFLTRVQQRRVGAVGRDRVADDALMLEALQRSREAFDNEQLLDEMLQSMGTPLASEDGDAASGVAGFGGPSMSQQAASASGAASARALAAVGDAAAFRAPAELDPAAQARQYELLQQQREEEELQAAMAASLAADAVHEGDVVLPPPPPAAAAAAFGGMGDFFISEEDQLRIMMEGGDPDEALLRFVLERSAGQAAAPQADVAMDIDEQQQQQDLDADPNRPH